VYKLIQDQISSNSANELEALKISSKTDVEVTGTTTFINDKESRLVEKPHQASISSLLTSNSYQNAEQNIKDFLSKPIRLASGAFATTDAGNTIIAQHIMATIAASSQFGVWTSKLKGFYAARFTMVFRMVVNATRFQQGRYILAFCPSGGVGGPPAESWFVSHSAKLLQVVQQPHAELDISTETEVVLKIPFTMNQTAIPITTFFSGEGLWDLGCLYLRPYSALVAASGSSSADYTIYLSLEDVELYGAATQSGASRVPRNGKSKKRGNISNVEQDQMGVGPFETGFKGLSLVSDSLSKIPLLSQFAGTAKWASDYAAGVCSKFGWCKPTDICPVTKTKRMIFPNFSNVDGADTSQVLALSQENIVEVCEGFSGSDLDEMNFSYLTSIQNYYGTFSFATTNNSGDLLQTINLAPADNHMFDTWSDHQTVKAMGTLNFVSSFHEFYRGSLIVKLKFVKTEFHSGRIAVAFFPLYGVTPVSYTYDDSAYVNRVILDLRENNEIEFLIPYISTAPYRDVNDPYGFIKIFCVDPLIAPNTVSSSISCIVELYGSNELEFAVPKYNNATLYLPTATQSGGDRISAKEYVGLKKLGESTFDEIVSSANCIGEKIVSFRSLIKRPFLWTRYNANSHVDGSYQQLAYIPFQLTRSYWTGSEINNTGYSDMIDQLASCYALSRGGVRHKLVSDTGSQTVIITQLLPTFNNSGIIPGYGSNPVGKIHNYGTLSVDSAIYGNCATAISRPDLTGGIEVQIPQYQVNHSRVNAMCINPSGSYYNDIRYGAPNLNVLLNFAQNDSGNVFRAGADDYSLGCFVSIPTFAV